MANDYSIEIAPIEPSGVVLSIAELPRLIIFSKTAEDALRGSGGDRLPPA